MILRRYDLLDGVSAVGASAPVQPIGEDKTFDIVITGVATVLIEVSNNRNAYAAPESATWHTLATITASGAYSNNEAWATLRARVSSYTSGTITVIMSASE